VRAEQIVEEFPVVAATSNALEAGRLMAERRLPGLVVTDTDGKPLTILPASQVVRLLVPTYVQDDPSLAGVLNESMAARTFAPGCEHLLLRAGAHDFTSWFGTRGRITLSRRSLCTAPRRGPTHVAL
jgi:CBS domain-containing protein